MEEECVIVEETSGTTPPQKKLKQGRLPFTPLQGKSPQTVGKQLKRKLSNSDLDCKSPKTPRSEAESIPKNGNQDESALSGTKDSKIEVSMKDIEELENKDKNGATDEKKDGVKENVKKRGRSAASKNNTPAKSTPAKSTPAKSTPAKSTPAKSTPAKSTPAKSTLAKSTPAKSTPAKSTPAKSTPAKSTPAKSTPSKDVQKEKEAKEKSNEEIVDDLEQKPKKRGRPSVAGNKTPGAKTPGKTPGKSTISDGKIAEQKLDKLVKQEEKLEEKTSKKGKDNSSENKTPGKCSKKLDKFVKKDSSEKNLKDKVDEKLIKLPDISDDSAEINLINGEKSNSMEGKSVEILDNKVQESKDQSKKRKASDEISNSTITEITAKESNDIKKETEKDLSVKKRSRNSLDAFVKKGAEAMAILEKQTKNRNETASKDDTPEGDIKEESEKIPKTHDCSESESEKLNNSDSQTSPKGSQVVIPKKITPGQLAKETERLKKKEEREKEKEERLKKKQQEIDEKNRIKEEERKKKEEEREDEKKQKEEEKKQKEEERQQKLKEKEQQKKELEKEKEEKKRMKQEEIDAKLKEKEEQRLKKEEEKRLQEEDERKQKEQAKAKFSSFFVAKKVVHSTLPKEKKNEYFCQFQLKKDMRLAPVTRLQLPNPKKEHLDNYLSGNKKESKEKLFINSIKLPAYSIGTSARTFPPQEHKEEENDCEVIEEEDDGIGEAVITSESVPKGKTTVRRKVLKFCENNRPPYCGTWRKKTKHITARRPFIKDEDFFNYEYDSDEDWEEEATGESLSDCEDEKDMDEDGKPETAENDYEVDNDFFVPHGYLSDDEGKSDQEEMENEMEVDCEKDTNKKKEQLKQKQTEFENEIKQKTRQLKPRVFGCLWLSEEDTNKAFDQLLKVLNPHRAVVCCSSKLPIATTYSKVKPKDTSKEVNESNQDGDDANGASKKDDKYAKNFPEEGVPALIKLLHCNINSKKFLGKEYCEFWKKNSEEGVEDSMASRHGLIAKARIDAKVSELGAIWGKNTEEGDKAKHMMWTVPLEVREKYGLSDLSANTWTYILKPKERKTQDGSEDPSDPKTPKINSKDAKTQKNITKDAKTPKVTDSKTPKITAFAKKVSPGSSMKNLSKTPSGTSGGPGPGTNGSTPKTPQTPSEVAPSSTGSQKQLFSKATQKNTPVSTPPKTPKSSITNFFKKKVDKENPKEEKEEQTEKSEKTEETEKKDVITLD